MIYSIYFTLKEPNFKIKVKTIKNDEDIVDLRNLKENMHKMNPRTVEDMTSLYYIHEAGKYIQVHYEVFV